MEKLNSRHIHYKDSACMTKDNKTIASRFSDSQILTQLPEDKR